MRLKLVELNEVGAVVRRRGVREFTNSVRRDPDG
jgi:hypothetical protein